MNNNPSIKTIFVAMAILLLSLTDFAISDPIPLYQNSHNIKNFVAPEIATNNTEWNSFFNIHGSWNISLNAVTGTPALAFGKPIKIINSQSLSPDAITEATKRFLYDNIHLFKVDTSSLKLLRVEEVHNKWYITFAQYFEEYEVLFSEVHLTINNRGEVFAFKITYFDDIDLPDTPQLPINDILNIVANSFNENPYFDNILRDRKATNSFQSSKDTKKFILPIYKDNNVSLHLVHKINTADANGMHLYESFIDAHNGEILWQKSTTFHFEANVKMNVQTFDKYNFEPEDIFPVSNGVISVNGTKKTLDNNGEITINQPAEIKFW